MQVVRPPQKAWRDPEATERTSVHPGSTRGYGILLVDFALPAANQAAHAGPKGSSRQQTSSSRHYCDPGALSGVVKGSSLESTTKTASRLADSLSLAFSLTV
jgi:hypothetical protein